MEKVELQATAEGVRVLTLTDPDKRNALGPQMSSEIQAACDEVRQDAGARVLVVTGAGQAFCAGADLPAVFGNLPDGVAEARSYLQQSYAAFYAVMDLPVPTIAAVNGPAVGAGLNLALSCDVRIAGPTASFGATFAKIGLHPGGGCTWLLMRAIGPSRALRTLVVGDTVDADRAAAWGLAEGPDDDPLASALELAGLVAAVDGQLVRDIKRTWRLATDSSMLPAVREYESWAQAASTSSPTFQDWVARFR